MRTFVVFSLALLAASGLNGCVSRNVAIVTDNAYQAPPVSDSLSHHISPGSLKDDDRLVLLGVRYKNPLRFRQEISIRQHPRASEGRSGMSIEPTGDNEDLLVLMKFKGDAGPTAYVQPLPCRTDTGVLWCIFTSSPNESHIKITLPAPGKAIYAGHLQYEIEDQFPDRGTQNHPLVRKLALSNEHEKDIAAALVKWPILTGRQLVQALGTVQRGRAAVFVPGSKEFKE